MLIVKAQDALPKQKFELKGMILLINCTVCILHGSASYRFEVFGLSIKDVCC